MRLDQAINKLLTTNIAVAGLVVSRVFKPVLPQSNLTYPAISHREITTEHFDSLGGPIGLRKTRFRVYSAAKTYDESKDLDEAVRLALAGFSGLVDDGGSPPSSIYIQYIEKLPLVDDFNDLTGTDQAISDYQATSHEEIPGT